MEYKDMRITWGNIDTFKLTKNDTFRRNNHYFILIEDCFVCGDPYFKRKDSKYTNSFCSPKCQSNSVYHNALGKKSNYKGGYDSNNTPLYETYTKQLEPYGVKCRRSPVDTNILEVKCMYCDKWYQPTRSSVRNKLNAITGKFTGELNLYCSDGCKSECPTYHKKFYPKGYKKDTSREVQPALRKLVLERDNWTCQKCESKENGLHCHHMEGIEINPVESADMDICITLCKDCHNKLHKRDDCNMRRRKCE